MSRFWDQARYTNGIEANKANAGAIQPIARASRAVMRQIPMPTSAVQNDMRIPATHARETTGFPIRSNG